MNCWELQNSTEKNSAEQYLLTAKICPVSALFEQENLRSLGWNFCTVSALLNCWKSAVFETISALVRLQLSCKFAATYSVKFQKFCTLEQLSAQSRSCSSWVKFELFWTVNWLREFESAVLKVSAQLCFLHYLTEKLLQFGFCWLNKVLVELHLENLLKLKVQKGSVVYPVQVSAQLVHAEDFQQPAVLPVTVNLPSFAK